MDIGGYYQTPVEGLTVGLAVQNVGTKIKYQDSEDPLPFKIRQGVAYCFEFDEDQKLVVALDEINFSQINLGAEYQVSNLFFLRAGYKQGDEISSVLFNGAWSCGAGFKTGELHLDYSINSLGILGLAHYFSMTRVVMIFNCIVFQH